MAQVITLHEMAVELRRELHVRKEVYSRLVRIGQLDRKEATKRWMRMQAALDFIVEQDQKNKGMQTDLFNDKSQSDEN